MKNILILISLLLGCFIAPAQNPIVVTGKVCNNADNQPIIGVTIMYETNSGTVSNADGTFSLELIENKAYTLKFSYLGYIKKNVNFTPSATNTTLNIKLVQDENELEKIVVTAGRHQQAIEEVTVSMTVITPELIQKSNANNIETLLNQVAGIEVSKEQVSIRGGSGYSYGAGSRVMVLVDGLPLMGSDAGDIKWNLLPVDNIAQIEIVKGASSALYGASAMDGIINIRTKTPNDNDYTKGRVSIGMYGKTARESWKFRDEPGMFYKMSLVHGKKIGKHGFVADIDLRSDDAFQKENDSRRMKYGLKWECKLLNQRLKIGVNACYLYEDAGIFLYWKNIDSVYVPAPNTVTRMKSHRFFIDPSIRFLDKYGNKHQLISRFFLNDNQSSDDYSVNSKSYYTEYQFQRIFATEKIGNFVFTNGVVFNYSDVWSSDLFGEHTGYNSAVYSQLGWKFGRLNFSVGGRYESFVVDSESAEDMPVFRSGLSVNIIEGGYLRTSIGQGFRFPSVAERFSRFSAGLLDIIPNPSLKPETGLSAEIGYRQLFKTKSISGFMDIVGFMSQYDDMMEYQFGFYDVVNSAGDTSAIPGMMSKNIENTQVYGIEFSLGTDFSIGDFDVNLGGGYTYVVPRDRDKIDVAGISEENTYLKYRRQHFVKADFSVDYKRFRVGAQYSYLGFMENVDVLLEALIQGVVEFRDENNEGYSLWNAMVEYRVVNGFHVGFFVKNLFNTEYMFFPGNMSAPINFSIACRFEF